ncbi:MAG: Uma2 family endonuclease, partial [Chloroflexi bacterium]|nr:Uma2 family endonuclease [Chloroflexota bacterium]
DLNIYLTTNPGEVPIAPDVAVFKGVVLAEDRDDYLSSWHVDPPEAPPPAVVFEIASAGTWRKDLEQKPFAYAAMGVREYVYFDPRPRPPARSPRMRVWKIENEVPVEVPADERGWVWSEELESWLAPERKKLILRERNGQRRLTGEEAERALRERAWAELRRRGVDPEKL